MSNIRILWPTLEKLGSRVYKILIHGQSEIVKYFQLPPLCYQIVCLHIRFPKQILYIFLAFYRVFLGKKKKKKNSITFFELSGETEKFMLWFDKCRSIERRRKYSTSISEIMSLKLTLILLRETITI